jgi:mRNA interferase RelE/StbE
MRYSAEFQPSARTALASLSRKVQIRIAKTISALGDNPHPSGSKKLLGVHGLWRIRVGDYRVLYTIDNVTFVVWILKLRHRREVYANASYFKCTAVSDSFALAAPVLRGFATTGPYFGLI